MTYLCFVITSVGIRGLSRESVSLDVWVVQLSVRVTQFTTLETIHLQLLSLYAPAILQKYLFLRK